VRTRGHTPEKDQYNLYRPCLPHVIFISARGIGMKRTTEEVPMPQSTAPEIDLPELNFDDMEVMSVREAVAVPETGATSGSSSCTSTSCCGSSSCCSGGSCG